MIGHIVERFVTHLFASAGCVLLAFMVLHAFRSSAWIPDQTRELLTVAALVVFGVIALREPYDVGRGGTVTKSIWDFASWALGCLLSCAGIWRIIG